MSRLAVPLLVFVLTGCNSSDSSEEQDPPQLPEISTFTATLSSIDEGSGTELLAVFTNGTSAQVDNGIETVVSSMLSNVPVWMVPRESTTYTLTVTNEDGEVSASVDVIVDERPILTVTKPLDHTVARPEVAVAASCTDDRGDCDISMSVARPELAVAAPCYRTQRIGSLQLEAACCIYCVVLTPDQALQSDRPCSMLAYCRMSIVQEVKGNCDQTILHYFGPSKRI